MASDKTRDKMVKVFDRLQGEGIRGLNYYLGFRVFWEEIRNDGRSSHRKVEYYSNTGFKTCEEYKPKNAELSERTLVQFFHSTTSSYLDRTILALSNLLKKDSQAVCINYLLNLFRQERLLLKQIQADEACLDDLRKEAEPFLEVRDKMVAHVDRAHITNPSEIEEIMNDLNVGAIEPLYQSVHRVLCPYGKELNQELSDLRRDWEIKAWTNELEELFILLDLGYTSRQKRKAAGIYDTY